MGKSFRIEAQEKAFELYRRLGGNMSAVHKQLNKDGHRISLPTLYDWKKEFKWDDRMARADAKAGLEDLPLEQKILHALIAQKEKYERYLDSITGVDNQAQFAYTNILKTIIDVKRKLNVSDVVKKAGADKAMTKEELLRLIKEDIYGLDEKQELDSRLNNSGMTESRA